jgi:hypothetical protein
MPTVIIKSGSTAFADAIVKGNFSYYVDPTIDLGPSESTGFYMGVEPPAGGYSIYKTANIDNGWTVRTATDSSSLNSVLKSYGAPHETVNDNIDWASANNDVLIYSGGTPSYYTWNLYYGFPFQVCNHDNPQITLYTSGTPLDVGTELFTDTSLTTPYSPPGGFPSIFVGAGNLGDFLYNVNSSGVIQFFNSRCGVSEADFGLSNISQIDAALANSTQHLWYTGDTPTDGSILYTNSGLTTPFVGSTYVSNQGYGWTVNNGTGVLSNQTFLGYYYGTVIYSCPNCNTVVSYNDAFSPSNSLTVSNHYYNGTYDVYITGPSRNSFISTPCVFVSPDDPNSYTCMCP